MNTRWRVTAYVAMLLVLVCTSAVAKENQGKGENRGQAKKHYLQFREDQRQYARTYYSQNPNHGVFKQDRRWNNNFENRLQPGYVLDRDMRGLSRPAPYDMTRGLGRAPRGYRYVVIGGHLVLIDGAYRVHDTIRFELSFGH